MTVTPNGLTIARIPLAIVTGVAIMLGRLHVALGVFCLGVLTDLFDGYLARTHDGVTTLGQLLDPVADKLLIGIGLVTLHSRGIVPGWAVWTILGREAFITSLRLVLLTRGRVTSSNWWGKIKMESQVAAVIASLVAGIHLEAVRTGFYCAATAMTVASGIVYAAAMARTGVRLRPLRGAKSWRSLMKSRAASLSG